MTRRDDVEAAVAALADRLASVAEVSDLWVAGSLATGDHVPGVSDLDLVALLSAPPTPALRDRIVAAHRDIDAGPAAGHRLGCQYVEAARLGDPGAQHLTWTHGRPVDRRLSGVTRAELVRHGRAVLGRTPADVLPAMSDDDVRRAAADELGGYWTWAVHRPWIWLDPAIAELGPPAMARGRHTLATGRLLTKSSAIDLADVPDALRERLRQRRLAPPHAPAEVPRLPRLRLAVAAWCDARRTVAAARRGRPEPVPPVEVTEVERTHHIDCDEPDDDGYYGYFYEYDLVVLRAGALTTQTRTYVDIPSEISLQLLWWDGVPIGTRDALDRHHPELRALVWQLRGQGFRSVRWLEHQGYREVPA